MLCSTKHLGVNGTISIVKLNFCVLHFVLSVKDHFCKYFKVKAMEFGNTFIGMPKISLDYPEGKLTFSHQM